MSKVRAILCSMTVALACAACASGGGAGDDDDDTPDAREQKFDARATPDAAPTPDSPPGSPDARPAVDAAPGAPDAPPAPDAPAGTPDAGGGSVCGMAAAAPDNDTCAAAIDVTTAAGGAGGATVYGDTTGYVDDLIPPTPGCIGYEMDGPDAIYAVQATAGRTLRATVTPEGWDVGVYILSTCSDAATCTVGADVGFSGDAETVDYVVPTTATYYVVVDGWATSAYGCFTLNVSIL